MSMFIKSVVVIGIFVLPISMSAVMADPIQGYAEQTEVPTRIQRPTVSVPYPALPSNTAPSTLEEPSLVNSQQFSSYPLPRRMPLPQQRVKTGGRGGSEYWVSWDTWRSRIADAVWGPLKKQGTTMWGMTRVDYDVTQDRQIRITSVRTPDPTGKSGRVLVAAIMQLNGGPLLTFPPGSKQTIHHNYNMDMGLPVPGKVHYAIHLRGGTEHVVSQY